MLVCYCTGILLYWSHRYNYYRNYWLSRTLFNPTMHSHPLILTILLLLSPTLTQIITNPTMLQNKLQACLTYQSGSCIGCPYNYHINKNQCYLNITHCISYFINNLAQQTCNRCNSTVAISDGRGGCLALQSQISSSISNPNSIQSIAQQYGDTRFQLIPLQIAVNEPSFIRCNNFMLNGEYSHFISRTSQPLYSVSTFTFNTLQQFKILYYASGGGLMMSIITISTQINSIQLNSFVAIATASLIDYCGQYNEALRCVACNIGYHLQNNQCYSNIGGCVSYSRNICLECSGFGIVIENRCVGCEESGDVGKIVFWGGITNWFGLSGLPKLSQNYLITA